MKEKSGSVGDLFGEGGAVQGTTRHGPSFLRWAGSKRKAIPALRSHYERDRRYVEPFAGSAALFFAVKPFDALLGDLNGHLINTLKAVRDHPDEVHEELGRFQRDKVTYYQVRQEFNRLEPMGLASAARFLYLNRNSFNGLWRTNLKGEFNVPWGGSEMGGHPPLELLRASSITLSRAQIEHQDFRATIGACGEGDFIYADPPYFTSSQRTFVEYGKECFGLRDLDDLIQCLVSANNRGANIAMSYTSVMELTGLPKHWQRLEFEVTRNVAGFKGHRKRQSEVLLIGRHV